jgi:hypothetical protein
VYDPELLGGSLPGLAPLASADLLTFVGPGGLGPMLDDLVAHIGRINSGVLAGEHGSLAELTEAVGARPEPWRVAVLLGDAATEAELTDSQGAQLARIVRTGAACGVHLVVRGLPPGEHPTVHRIALRPDEDRRAAVPDEHRRVAAPDQRRQAGTPAPERLATCTTTGELPVRLDPPPPADRVAGACRDIAERLLAGPPPAELGDLRPAAPWRESSAAGLVAPLGLGPDGRPVEVALGDDPPHALIAGPSGSGKTNLIYSWLAGLCARYCPDELSVYLLDFSDGVSFARFAPSPRDPSWLPQARLVGINLDTDAELGVALLRHLVGELRRRARAAHRYDATKLSELRAEDPDGHWPRIVAVIDEFQILLDGRDGRTTEAMVLLAELARRGRSQGIHLVLAAQDVRGVEALWGRAALAAQFALRIALPKARGVLAENNLAADVIPRFHAVVNADSGVPGANRVVRLPDAGDRGAWRRLQEELWRKRPEALPAPRVFDGHASPQLPREPTAHRPAAALPAPRVAGPGRAGTSPGDGDSPAVALLGEAVDVTVRPTALWLTRSPGRNLAILGGRVADACAVLGAAGRSLADGHPPGAARFSVACLDDRAGPAAMALHRALPGAAWHDARTIGDLFEERRDESPVPHFILAYGCDAAGSGPDRLRELLIHGPQRGIHLLGWWRSVDGLRASLGGPDAPLDAVGAWVALDVPGEDLAPLWPARCPQWRPRPRRALFFDRTVHRSPEVIIPYEVTQ